MLKSTMISLKNIVVNLKNKVTALIYMFKYGRMIQADTKAKIYD